jgi:hypothetical protein
MKNIANGYNDSYAAYHLNASDNQVAFTFTPAVGTLVTSLGSPPAKIRTEDHVTIGTNQDGRLEAFVMGQDGNVWRTLQIR